MRSCEGTAKDRQWLFEPEMIERFGEARTRKMQGMLEARGLKRSHPDMEPNDPDATQWKTLVKDATTELDEKDHTTSLRMSCSTDELDDDAAASLQPFFDNFSVEDDGTPSLYQRSSLRRRNG